MDHAALCDVTSAETCHHCEQQHLTRGNRTYHVAMLGAKGMTGSLAFSAYLLIAPIFINVGISMLPRLCLLGNCCLAGLVPLLVWLVEELKHTLSLHAYTLLFGLVEQLKHTLCLHPYNNLE